MLVPKAPVTGRCKGKGEPMAVLQRTGLRNIALAGGIVLALSGAGAAVVWAEAGQSAPSQTSPSPSPPAPAPTDKKVPGEGRGQAKNRGMALHSETVVKKADGGFETRLAQQGAVEAVSASSITVKSEDGFSQAYAITADTRITRLAATAADLKAGDQVRIAGFKDASGATARQIVAGSPGDQGPGRGRGHGMGKHLGQGHWKDKAPGQAP